MESKNSSLNQHNPNTIRNLCDTYLRYARTSFNMSTYHTSLYSSNCTARVTAVRRDIAPRRVTAPRPAALSVGRSGPPANATHPRRRVAFCFAAPANIGGGGYI